MLLLYLTSDNNLGLLDEICTEKNLIINQQNGEFSLNQFIISDMNNLTCCEYLVIDLSCLSDDDDDIINAIVGIKSMYDFRIIILALSYENSNPLLGRIFAEGIYNIITANRTVQQQFEIKKCLSESGMLYKDSIKYRLQSDYVPNTNSKKKQKSKVIIQKQPIKQTISIGICGSLHRIGTTKQALHITRFLNDNGYTACYVENNDHGHMDNLDDFYNVDKREKSFVRLEGVDIFPTFDMGEILAGGYDFIIYDNGLYEDSDKHKFLEYDIKIVCVGSTSWEAQHVNPIFAEIGNYSDIHFIFSFTSPDLHHEILSMMGIYKSKVYFAEYAPSLIDGVTNAKLYRQIFDDYIHEKLQTNSKKGFFDRLKR